MCGIIRLGDQTIETYCEIIDPFWWRDPGPLIDFGRFKLGDETVVDRGQAWKGELSKITDILSAAGQFEDAKVSDHIGRLAAEAGNMIAERAQVGVQFEWSEHFAEL